MDLNASAPKGKDIRDKVGKVGKFTVKAHTPEEIEFVTKLYVQIMEKYFQNQVSIVRGHK
jgi:hypothetical protein